MTLTKSRPPKPKKRKSLAINSLYEDKAKNNLRVVMADAKIDYAELAKRINALGLEISVRGLENKISRGSFSAAFYLQCMDAIGEEKR